MSQTAIDISCPHCKQSYRIKVDLDRLSRVRTRAVCARCGQRFDVAARLRTSESAPRPADAKPDIQEVANESERKEFGHEPRASSAPMLASRPPTTELTRSVPPEVRTSAPPPRASSPPEVASADGPPQTGAVVSGGRTWFSAGAPGENRNSNVAALKPAVGGELPPSLPPEVLDDEFDRVFTDITARASAPPAVSSEAPRARLSDSPEVVITSVPPDDDTNYDYESDMIEMDGATNSGAVVPGPTRPPEPAVLTAPPAPRTAPPAPRTAPPAPRTAPPAPREPRPRISTPAQGFSIPPTTSVAPVMKTAAPAAPATPSQRPVGWSVPPEAARQARAANRSLTPARMTAPPSVSSAPPRRLSWLEHAYPGFDGLVARETCAALARLLEHDPRQRPVESKPPERK